MSSQKYSFYKFINIYRFYEIKRNRIKIKQNKKKTKKNID